MYYNMYNINNNAAGNKMNTAINNDLSDLNDLARRNKDAKIMKTVRKLNEQIYRQKMERHRKYDQQQANNNA